MRKPSALTFFTLYVCLWFAALIIVGSWVGTSNLPAFYGAVSAANLGVTCINCIGMVIYEITGWAPWREE